MDLTTDNIMMWYLDKQEQCHVHNTYGIWLREIFSLLILKKKIEPQQKDSKPVYK